ncbi:SH3 domain-containing protein [Rhizobium sp. 'Codium 1']|uniref:SH3 domain-containing protein n=1 Tax=Rhizobium sp. 'Codium 1' TaxID=2940484 RepID=UPI001E4782B7|nr:SH3 domain-containing protein [Rhizobium sp. 'Codium 1']MCC8931003.1 SH3 domain-containing protein [Rhizobium sp. 'Codium 1']
MEGRRSVFNPVMWASIYCALEWEFRLKSIRFMFALLGAFSVANPSWALSISVEQIDASNSFVLVSGVFEAAADLTPFIQAVQRAGGRGVTVVFNSPGGNPSKAIELGRLIRSLGLSTLQPRSLECVSACALAFMGGVSRVAETGSIGVHKSSFSDVSGISVDDAVSYIQQQTAETIAYLTEMGIDPGLLQLSLRYERDDMRYLSKSEMAQYRVITTELSAPQTSMSVEPRAPSAPNPPPTAGAALPDNRLAADDTRFTIPQATSGVLRVPKGREFLRAAEDQSAAKLVALNNGEPVEIVGVGERWYRVNVKGRTGYLHHNWVRVDQFLQKPFGDRFIQVKSFDNFEEAQSYVKSSQLPLVAFLAANKWYAIALEDTLPVEKATKLLKGLKERSLVPDDAFVTVGNTYVNEVCCKR